MTVYFDTSALIKLFVVEAGSELSAAAWDGAASIAASRLLYPEACAALAAATAARRLDRRRAGEALTAFEAAFAKLRVIEIDERLARHAGSLAGSHLLRGYDAVHLASALALTGEIRMVTWDRDLARAALGEGLAVIGANGR